MNYWKNIKKFWMQLPNKKIEEKIKKNLTFHLVEPLDFRQ